MTYPTIDLLENQIYGNRHVLEWGSGNSTLWWAGRAARVVSFESNMEWFERVKRQSPDNVELHMIGEDLAKLPSWLFERPFDIIVVDGLNRFRCLEVSVGLLTRGGAIIVDDTDQPWSASGKYVITELMRSLDYQRIDFYGFAPGVIRRHCTSIFFKDSCFLFRGDEHPHRYD